ncbi:sigma-54-dependent Fis family transcriptional regulator [Rhodoblastus sp. 17X3]|uniref:sigma-54-dependent Fis family transcriptional regulator n=1 Tax=Rhodoblastus sp. 17X3 TaxID=3047026 RepID=UPI0024B768E4|nr:sigma-54-dependent Fis family transcriptional regulator [Rhodoblastus sp. 17X3]MDI9847823.1 sigma-54-dependent Fis family transcriptional regulator [Rhodoblastus sp. 17X3]
MKKDVSANCDECSVPSVFRSPALCAGVDKANGGCPYEEGVTIDAWENFVSGGVTPNDDAVAMRPVIQNSWSRSATCGIDANGSYAPLSDNRDEIEYIRHSNSELRTAARRSIEAVGNLLHGTGAMFILADRNAVVLEAVGDQKTLFNGMDIHLTIGGQWREDSVGTNGIGTALATGEPVFVHAAEHFCSGIRGWTCAGAPIHDPLDGAIIGVVDLSGFSPIFRPHNTAMVAAAARDIENALMEQQRAEQTRLLESFIASAPSYAQRDGLVIVDRHGRTIFTNNLPARVLSNETGGATRFERGSKVLSTLANITALNSALPSDLRDSCHVTPLNLGGNLRGAALVFPFSATAVGRRTFAVPALASGAQTDAASLIIGRSDAIREAVDVASRAAQSKDKIALLIEGETGVGKELFAKLVHLRSQKSASSPFVALNCGAITRELFGSELFGHVGGAFTGAAKEGKLGVFELANGGVLSLDEIGELPLDIQAFLLRVLEERVVRRIGDNKDRPVDIRLVASTNRDLKLEIEAGRFRRDLYYRIGAVSISVPPLRERGDDILLLLEHFSCKTAEQMGREKLRFSPEALYVLMDYRWPGNVRELRNLVSRLHLLVQSDLVRCSDLPADILSSPKLEKKKEEIAAADCSLSSSSLEFAEREAIRSALLAENGNLSRVAHRLGISRPTLYRKVNQYGIRRSISLT